MGHCCLAPASVRPTTRTPSPLQSAWVTSSPPPPTHTSTHTHTRTRARARAHTQAHTTFCRTPPAHTLSHTMMLHCWSTGMSSSGEGAAGSMLPAALDGPGHEPASDTAVGEGLAEGGCWPGDGRVRCWLGRLGTVRAVMAAGRAVRAVRGFHHNFNEEEWEADAQFMVLPATRILPGPSWLWHTPIHGLSPPPHTLPPPQQPPPHTHTETQNHERTPDGKVPLQVELVEGLSHAHPCGKRACAHAGVGAGEGRSEGPGHRGHRRTPSIRQRPRLAGSSSPMTGCGRSWRLATSA